MLDTRGRSNSTDAWAFVEVGHERETVFQHGRFADYVVLDILDREFEEWYPLPD